MEDNDRERDIQELCKQVRNISAIYHESSGYSSKENKCPFCFQECYWNEGMDKIEHENNCAYLIAKDLLTNKIK